MASQHSNHAHDADNGTDTVVGGASAANPKLIRPSVPRGGGAKPNKQIDTQISTPPFRFPLGTIETSRGEPTGPTPLATRNLLRHITWEIPSGEQVASAMNAGRLAAGDLTDSSLVVPLLGGRTQRWRYAAREPDPVAAAHHVGPIGGR